MIDAKAILTMAMHHRHVRVLLVAIIIHWLSYNINSTPRYQKKWSGSRFSNRLFRADPLRESLELVPPAIDDKRSSETEWRTTADDSSLGTLAAMLCKPGSTPPISPSICDACEGSRGRLAMRQVYKARQTP